MQSRQMILAEKIEMEFGERELFRFDRLAQAFSDDKPIVFLDEPTSNLDRKGITILKRKLAALDTLVVVSYDRALLNEICTRIIEIEGGKLTE